MKFHLIRSEEVSKNRFRTIAEIIGKFKGPIEFIFRKEDLSEDSENSIEEYYKTYGNVADTVVLSESDAIRIYALQRLPWKILFSRCENFRQDKKIKPGEVVVLLTDYGNEQNYFSTWDPSGKLNFFVQTSMWDTFIEAESCYPIIYELAATALYIESCDSPEELDHLAHQTAQGCAFDYCINKRDIKLKLRTGDICPDCREKMIQKNIDPAIARQVFAIFDGVRSQMLFRQRFQITKLPSRMEVDLVQRKLRFTDIGNVSVKLDPREMTVYHFFLKHRNGVAFSFMPDHINEIRDTYRRHASTSIIATIESRVKAIVENSEDTLSGLITHINKKIRQTVGAEIASNYVILGDKGERRTIALDRNLLIINDLSFRK